MGAANEEDDEEVNKDGEALLDDNGEPRKKKRRRKNRKKGKKQDEDDDAIDEEAKPLDQSFDGGDEGSGHLLVIDQKGIIIVENTENESDEDIVSDIQIDVDGGHKNQRVICVSQLTDL